MEFKISKQHLVRVVSRAAPSASSKSPIAILTHLRLVAKGGLLTATGTDLLVCTTASVACAEKRAGSVAVVARTFFDMVKSLPAGDVSVAVSKDGSRLEVKSGKSKFRVPFVPDDDFPAMGGESNGETSSVVSSADLARVLRQSAYARETDESREFVACVRLEFGDVLTGVAADGKRMAMATAQISGKAGAIHIGTRGIGELSKLCAEHADADVKVTPVGPYVRFSWPECALIAKTVDTNFVPYRKLIPSAYDHEIRADRETLIASLKRAMLLSGARDGAVDLSVSDGECTLSVDADGGSVSDTFDVDYAGKNAGVRINPAHVMEALNTLTSDSVAVKFSPDSPVVIQGEAEAECMALSMPMR